MSGWDYLAVCVLGGFVIIVCCLDWLRTRRHQHLHDLDDEQRHRQLMSEIRRLP
jgi:hypothetical protein